MNLDDLPPAEFIHQYLLEIRGRGVLASYEEHEIIGAWLEACPDPDKLLLHLDDLLPKYFKKGEKSGRSGSLKGVHKSVMKRLRENAHKSAPSL